MTDIITHQDELTFEEFLRRINLLNHTPETIQNFWTDSVHFDRVIFNTELKQWEEFSI